MMSDHRIVIRRATAADAPAILNCLAVAFEPYRASYTPGAYLDTVLTAETIAQRLESMQVLVAAVTDEQVIGTIACAMSAGAEGHLRGMAVQPKWQGRGVAEKLLRFAEVRLTRQTCSRITLDTTEPLLRAMRFYEKHGYRRSGKTVDFFGMPLHEYVKQISRRLKPPREDKM